MPESIGGSFSIFDEFKNMFGRTNPSFENISGEISLYSKYAMIFTFITKIVVGYIFQLIGNY